MVYKTQRIAVLLLLSMFAIGHTAFSQTFHLTDLSPDGSQLTLRYTRPFLERMEALWGIYNIDLELSLGGEINLMASLPISAYELTGIGKFRFGVRRNVGEQEKHRKAIVSEIYLSTAEDDEVNLASSIIDITHLYRYVPEATIARVSYIQKTNREQGFGWGFEVGPSFFFSSNENLIDVALNYGLSGIYGLQYIDIVGEFNGIYAVAGGGSGDFGDRSFHLISLGVAYKRGPFRPGLYIGTYLDDGLSDIVDALLGIKLTYRP